MLFNIIWTNILEYFIKNHAYQSLQCLKRFLYFTKSRTVRQPMLYYLKKFHRNCSITWKNSIATALLLEKNSIVTASMWHCFQNSTCISILAIKMDCKIFRSSPPRGVPRKRCSENMQQIYRRTPMPISIKLERNFNEITLQHGCCPVNMQFSEHLFVRAPLVGCFWNFLKVGLNCMYYVFAYK